MEKSKTIKELFEQEYPVKELAKSPMMCVEAIGYLNAITEYFPSERIWSEPQMSALKLIFVIMMNKWGTNMWQEFSTGLTTSISEVMKIIDDALCFGFEFKVENHKLYFREVS